MEYNSAKESIDQRNKTKKRDDKKAEHKAEKKGAVKSTPMQ